MTPSNLTTRQQSLLALALMFLLGLTLIFGIGLPAVNHYRANQVKIQELRKQLQHYTGKVLSRDSVVAQTVELKSTILDAEIFSAQKSIPLVYAEMQTSIKKIVAEAGGELSSTQNLAQKPVDGLIKLGIHADFSGKIENLKHILYVLESAKPYMIIENIKIYGESGSGGKIDATNKINIVADIVTHIPSGVQ